MKSKITFYHNPIVCTLRMIKFTGEKGIMNKEKTSAFMVNVNALAEAGHIEYIEDLLCEPYNSKHNIRSYIRKELKDKLYIEDIAVCRAPFIDAPVNFSRAYNDEGGAVICYMQKPGSPNSDEFMEKLLQHIEENKPLAIKEKDLPKFILEMRKTEHINKGYLIYAENIKCIFIPDVVLEHQRIEDKLIKDLLEEYNISIVDYIYI